jgi:hypothetical protein
MNAAPAQGQAQAHAVRPQGALAALFIAAGAATIAFFIVDPRAAVRGWLLAFVLFSQVALGAMALLLLHNLIHVRWGIQFASLLRALALGMPLLTLFWIPIAIHLSAIYPWASSPSRAPPDVYAIYLNPASFALRSITALAGWMLFALLLLIKGAVSRLTAALGLVFFGLSSYVFGFDWILSVGAPFISSAFNAEIAIQCLMAGLAACALFAPNVADEQARGDVGGFLLAASLGVFYFGLMSYIVNWYGNLPDQAEWYLDRGGRWLFVLLAAVIFGAAVPIVSLLYGSVRNNGWPLRLVGASALLGVALDNLWLFAPLMTAQAILAAAIAFIAMMGALVRVQQRGRRLSPEGRRSDV